MKQLVLGSVLALGLVMGSPGGSPAQDLGTAVRESYSTNLHLLAEATRSAVAELFLGFSAPEGATLLVEGPGTMRPVGLWKTICSRISPRPAITRT